MANYYCNCCPGPGINSSAFAVELLSGLQQKELIILDHSYMEVCQFLMDIFSPSKFEEIRQSEDEMVTEYKIITATSLRRQEGLGI